MRKKKGKVRREREKKKEILERNRNPTQWISLKKNDEANLGNLKGNPIILERAQLRNKKEIDSSGV